MAVNYKQCMSEIFGNEPLAQFPELERARNLFIALFNNDTPLINLGYSSSQRAKAKKALGLIQEEGRVLNPNSSARSLYFSDKSGVDVAEITQLIQDGGFHLYAGHDPTAGGGVENLIFAIEGAKPTVFGDSFTVAEVNLLNPEVNVADLDGLMKIFYGGGNYTRTAVTKKNPLSVLGRAAGVTGTYRAAWVDSETKLEFVAEISLPQAEQFEPDYHRWRRLPQLADLRGEVTSFGRRPNVSRENVLEVFNRQATPEARGIFVVS